MWLPFNAHGRTYEIKGPTIVHRRQQMRTPTSISLSSDSKATGSSASQSQPMERDDHHVYAARVDRRRGGANLYTRDLLHRFTAKHSLTRLTSQRSLRDKGVPSTKTKCHRWLGFP